MTTAITFLHGVEVMLVVAGVVGLWTAVLVWVADHCKGFERSCCGCCGAETTFPIDYCILCVRDGWGQS
jgi:hypothetical protein